MNKGKKFTAKYGPVFLGFVIFAILVGALCVFIVNVFRWFSGLESEIAASIITASAVALISTGGLIISKQYEHKREIRREHNNKKVPVYEALINFSSKIQTAEKTGGKPPTEQETIKFFAEFTPKLIVWGSENVIRSYCEFRDTAIKGGDSPNADILFKYENLLLNIRKDLGHKNKGIKKGDILRLSIIDIDKYL